MVSFAEGSDYLASLESDFQFILGELKEKLEFLKSTVQSGATAEAKNVQAKIEETVEEAYENLERMNVEVQSLATNERSKFNTPIREFRQQIDSIKKQARQATESSSRSQLFGDRDANPFSDPQDQSQRSQLLSSQQRLERSSDRLRDAQRVGNETEAIGAGILNDLRDQREQIVNSRDTLMEADGYVDKSLRTLRSMARRMAANKIISYAIIAVLALLIIFIIVSKIM